MSGTKTKVIVVGGGIAGPVLAIILKSKGYDPIVYEKVDALADVGLSIWYAPNHSLLADVVLIRH